jgi:hypothetical protein
LKRVQLTRIEQRDRLDRHRIPIPGANPTIASYNASVVNFYNATGSLGRSYIILCF